MLTRRQKSAVSHEKTGRVANQSVTSRVISTRALTPRFARTAASIFGPPHPLAPVPSRARTRARRRPHASFHETLVFVAKKSESLVLI